MSDGTIKPLIKRPLDFVYFSFFFVHFFAVLFVDILPLWPSFLRDLPISGHLYALGKSFEEDYIAKTNDPFMLATRGMTQRSWEFMDMKVFMWMEM